MPRTDLLTTAEAAEALGCSVKTVARMVEDGRLDAHMKLPGRTGPYLFTAAEINRATTALARAIKDAITSP